MMHTFNTFTTPYR